MNMNKNLLIVLFTIISFFAFSGVVKANSTTINCNSYRSQRECSIHGQCRWMSNACHFQYVAQEPCNDNNIRTALKIFGYVLLLAKVTIPLLIIGFGVMDLYKAVIDKDEKSLTKQVKRVLMRIVTGLIVFFIPSIINAAFSLSDRLNIMENEDYLTCASCILTPLDDGKCETTPVFDN